jgi:hypothetical protein
MIQRILYVGLITGFCILGDVTAQNTSNESNPVWGNWEKWGEQNDGTYRNPIIPADYSDIDCIQVGDDYYAISSTFQFSPGMTLLHSKDLVNWEFCGNIISDLTQIGTKLNWDQMDRYARGVWAGTLRYHNGRFYLFFGTPDEGYFMTSSSKPEGQVKASIMVTQGTRPYSPCIAVHLVPVQFGSYLCQVTDNIPTELPVYEVFGV